MNEKLILVGIFLAIVLPIAFIMDRNQWKKKSTEELKAMIEDDTWIKLPVLLKELRKRNEDISVYVPYVLNLLIAESKIERTTGKIALKDHYRELYDKIPDYEATADIEKCREAVKPLLPETT